MNLTITTSQSNNSNIIIQDILRCSRYYANNESLVDYNIVGELLAENFSKIRSSENIIYVALQEDLFYEPDLIIMEKISQQERDIIASYNNSDYDTSDYQCEIEVKRGLDVFNQKITNILETPNAEMMFLKNQENYILIQGFLVNDKFISFKDLDAILNNIELRVDIPVIDNIKEYPAILAFDADDSYPKEDVVSMHVETAFYNPSDFNIHFTDTFNHDYEKILQKIYMKEEERGEYL